MTSTPDHQTAQKIICFHCGEECPGKDIYIDDKNFCCNGCKAVYEILNEKNLCTYYTFEKTPGSKPGDSRFDYLDSREIENKLLSFQNDSVALVTFYIPQIHCTSCIWILENLYRLNEGIFHSEVNFVSKTATIKYHKQKVSLKEVVTVLASVGYEPLIQLDSLERGKDITENKKLLYRLGIAGFCFGNIMLLSFPEYLSIDITETFYRKLFAYLNFILSLPVLFYSASDYFISAYTSLKKKIININLPLSIGIAVLFIRSCWEIFTNTGAGYFDSMTGLVFLLLIGKYIQQRTYSSLNFERDYKSYFPLSVVKKTRNEEISVPVSELLPGDRILIRNNEIIPADSVLIAVKSYIDYSFITGESNSMEVKQGELVYAGGRLKGYSVELEVIKEVSQSYLTSLWNNEVFNKKSERDFSTFTNIVSRYFTAGVIVIAVVAGLFWLPDWYNAMNVFTAVLIVACPCALALSVPFTFGNAMRVYGRNSFYLKNSLSIEELSKADTVVIDKTGTITENNNSVVTYFGKSLSDELKDKVKSISGNSSHPLSRKIAESMKGGNGYTPVVFNETEGEGIEGIFTENKIRMGSHSFVTGDYSGEYLLNKTHVHLSVDDTYMGYFEISNSYREGIFDNIKELQKRYEVFLLSGDNEGEKEFLSGIFDSDKMLFRQSPHNKLDFVNKLKSAGKKVLMIGDGLNDAGALKESDFGISVTDNISNFSPACDAILGSNNLNKLNNFLKFSKDARAIIYLNLAVSLLYNIAGLTFAVEGLLTPLIAAVLMPVSSITVVALAVLGTNLAARRRGLTS
jgi:P-type Cu+ transporter